MWRHIASNALTFLVVLAFLLGGVILWGQNEYTAEGPLEDRVCLQVRSGSNMRGVSRQLEEMGAVSNASIYRVGAEYSGKNSQLKAGSWLLPEGASMQEIVDIVTRGGASTCGTEVVYRIGVTRSEAQVRELDPATDEFVTRAEFDLGAEDQPEIYGKVRGESDTRYRIAIAEGVTSWQIATTLGQIDVLEGEAAEVPAEGSLAPDSYEVSEGDTVAAVLERMDAAQDLLLAAAWENRAEGIPLKDPYEALILASIIEKETGVAEERGQVASVFTNRLERGMKLQTDPTVIYGITEGKGVLGRGLRQSELRKRTDWNTYVIDGLPPTPIANPGKASLEAAVNPDTTDYIFFVADGTGGHAFARTLEEHNKNVAEWRKIEAERAAD
ncbi:MULTISPECIES: endolytic transglycosylase MltG [unclassified Roseovarius]|uniref:endolytic transglycosylase MltG n=1 Tax=unclassified Roseovarius TaxID=2614913 RepID=UPI00273EC682|nr:MULTISPECIES: endolytic transglycosylase MltG [unclassified Roseovarius]